MTELVDAHEESVERAEQSAEHTKEHIQRADNDLSHGINKIRDRNKLRRWCILITLLIILAIALGLGLGLGLR